MFNVPILELKPTEWHCPSCGLRTTSATRDTVFHQCGALAGLNAPMLPFGVEGKHVVNQREDYEGSDMAQRDANGRVVMSIQTVRDEGEDCTVLAPTAVMHAS